MKCGDAGHRWLRNVRHVERGGPDNGVFRSSVVSTTVTNRGHMTARVTKHVPSHRTQRLAGAAVTVTLLAFSVPASAAAEARAPEAVLKNVATGFCLDANANQQCRLRRTVRPGLAVGLDRSKIWAEHISPGGMTNVAGCHVGCVAGNTSFSLAITSQIRPCRMGRGYGRLGHELACHKGGLG